MRAASLALLLLAARPGDGLRAAPASPRLPSLHRAAPPRVAAVVLSEEPPSEAEEATEQVTLQQRLQLFQRLAVPYFQKAEGAKLNAGLMLLLVLTNSAISVIFSYVGRDFYSALSAKDQAVFLEKTANYAVGLAVATPLSVFYRFQRQRLALNWREWMTTELARQYYADQTYYKIEIDPEIDNPDQRITEDVQTFTKVSLDFFITLMTAAIDLVSFSGILYSIYPELFYAIFAYAGFGSVTTVYLGKKLVGQNAEQLLREANLRYSLVRLRENAESIAFYQGEQQEEAEVAARLGGAITNQRAILGTKRNLEFFTTAYSYLVQILPVLVVSPLYFAGSIELGVITQSTGAFNHVLNDLSIIVNQFEGLSYFSAGLGRLGKFVERMEEYQSDEAAANATFRLSDEQLARLMPPEDTRSAWDYVLYGREGKPPAPPAPPAPAPPTTVEVPVAVASAAEGAVAPLVGVVRPTRDGRIWNEQAEAAAPHRGGGGTAAAAAGGGGGDDAPVLSVRDMCLLTPDGARQLFANVSVEVHTGRHLLIMGNSGTGKSSMLRAVAGLWDRGSGGVVRPPTSQTMFLPQRPYCTLGSLRQQLVYPQTVERWQSEHTDEPLLQALRTVQLARLAEGGAAGLDDVRDWGDELSLGEQQRLAFARVLVNKPRLAILDEATSALDLRNEAVMYKALAAIPGITFLSVGHRPSLLRFHADRLRLLGNDAAPCFEIEQIDDDVITREREANMAL